MVTLIDLIESEYGWTDDYILNLRPYTRIIEIAEAILKRKKREQYEYLYGFAFLAAVIASINSRRKFSPEDFLRRPEEEEKIEKSLEELKLFKWKQIAKRKGLREVPVWQNKK